MSQIQEIAVRRSGMQTALDILVAPRAAFAQLRETPTWVWAFVIACVLGMVATLAIAPVTGHFVGAAQAAKLAADPRYAQLPADQRNAQIQQIVSITQLVVRFSFIFIPFAVAVSCAIRTVIMLVANAIGKGDGNVKMFWALSVNASIVGTGLSSIVLMVIVLIRGVDGFATAADISAALPGLGMAVPSSAKAASAFLSVFNVFSIWETVLLAAGMIVVARLNRTAAIVTAAIMLVASGIIPLASALAQK